MIRVKHLLHLVRFVASRFFELVFALLFCYLLGFLMLSPFSHSREQSTEPETETILISTNGIHSDIILPIRNPLMNWEKHLGIHQALQVDTFQTHLKFGWGDKQFFMRTKEWSDMEVGVVLKTIFGRGAGAMHLILCTPKDLDSNSYIALNLSKTQYIRLCNFIAYSFQYQGEKAKQIVNHPYGSYDLFFDSKLSYNMFFTCNTWTNKALHTAGQASCYWTPFKGPIFSKFKQ